ncbi:cyclic nucleotide-binding domain-containing protein [candidate division KSB1 bacterium]|nr:cyclic nucleotide-binding domain-containing protein [candidate division KSB1 bacterium]
MLTIVEKVLFLQEVDIFENTKTEDLSHIAAITDEISVKTDTDIYNAGDVSDSMYLVIEGKVRLHHNERQVMIAQVKDAFGTWALFDDEPRVVTATALEDSVLLKINREDFYDLLADHLQITLGIMKTLSKRLRSLVNRVRR